MCDQRPGMGRISITESMMANKAPRAQKQRATCQPDPGDFGVISEGFMRIRVTVSKYNVFCLYRVYYPVVQCPCTYLVYYALAGKCNFWNS